MLDRRDFTDATRLVGRVSIGLLAPVFFVTAGFQISLSAAVDNWVLLVAVVTVATLGKIFGTALFYLPTGYGWREGLVAGGAMNGRGAVEIIVAGIGLERGLISTEVFTVLVLMAILTTATVPIFLKLGVEWLRTRGELAEAGTNRKAVTIVGAGSIGRAWARALGQDTPVWLLDSNSEHVALARGDGLLAVNGDALDPHSLRRARADEAGLLLALTANDEVNVLVADLADEEFGVPDIRVAFHGDGTNNGHAARLLSNRHATALFEAPVDIDRWGRWLEDGQAAVTTIVATEPEELLRRLRTGRAGLPLAVTRGDDILPFPRVERLYRDDRVTLVTRQDIPHEAVATSPAAV